MLMRKTLKPTYGFLTAAVRGHNNVNKSISIKVYDKCLIAAEKLNTGNIFKLENALKLGDRRFSESYTAHRNDSMVELQTGPNSSIHHVITEYDKVVDLLNARGTVIFIGYVSQAPTFIGINHESELRDEDNDVVEIFSAAELEFNIGDKIRVNGSIFKDGGITAIEVMTYEIITTAAVDHADAIIDEFNDA